MSFEDLTTNMNLCLFDWRAFTPIIAALLPSIIASVTAFKISDRWSVQKNNESKAVEAKNIIFKIIEIEKLNNSIANTLHLKSGEIEKLISRIKDFQRKTDDLHCDFDFLKELIGNKENVSQIMNRYLSHSTLSVVRYNALMESVRCPELIHRVAIKLKKDHIEIGDELKKILDNYASYKK